jgi:hypothetical protein
MSHITKVKTRLKDGVVLRSVLENLGYTVKETGALINRHERTKVEFTAATNRLVIGFNRTDEYGCYEIYADWYGKPKAKILGEIFQNYSREKVIKMARIKGFSVVQNKVDQNGRIEMVLRKVA